MERKLSAASIRAQAYTKGPEWFCELRTQGITGDLAENREGVIRRDPSAVIQVGDRYTARQHEIWRDMARFIADRGRGRERQERDAPAQDGPQSDRQE